MYYIKQLINNGLLDFIYIISKYQKADGLIKPLGAGLFNAFIKQLGLN